jgi:hypothetical protein
MEHQKYQHALPLVLVCYNTETGLLWVSIPLLLCLERKPVIEHQVRHGNSNEHKRDVFSWLECVWKYLRDLDNCHDSDQETARRHPIWFDFS